MPFDINVSDLATRLGTEFKTVRTQLTGNATGSLTALTTVDKTSLIGAINEVADAVAGSSGIDDGVTGTTTTWSSTKIDTEIDAAVASLVGTAPAALDTIQELATALGSATAVTDLTTAVGNRVRYDAAQTLTDPQQVQARTNIGAAAAADLGDPNADFVATFEAALV